jgi:hypothetical protein
MLLRPQPACGRRIEQRHEIHQDFPDISAPVKRIVRVMQPVTSDCLRRSLTLGAVGGRRP